MKIAIDGPAGAGKSTVAKRIAKQMSINYLDTGAMYRAIAYALISMEIDVNASKDVEANLPCINICVQYEDGRQKVLVNGQNVMPYIRTPEISKAASDVAVHPCVRIKLVELQRQVADNFDIVMDGRDIGTYVLPNADIKFFITASPRIRAQRRLLQLEDAGIPQSLDQLEQEIINRDKVDSGREFAPLRQAKDAILVDTSSMDIQQTVDFVMEKIKGVQNV